MEDFQNVLVTIGPPLSYYINTTPYFGDNVVFLVNYAGKYYALPSWYAGESNGNYYFFISLLNIPSLYNSNNFGCNFLPIFVGFSNENLLPYLNGTIGGDPYALDPNNPYYVVMYDNGLNVFPIYVNFYPYPGSNDLYRIEDGPSCSNSNGYPFCYQNILYENVLPPYNNLTIYLNGTGVNIEVVTNEPFEGLVMDNGTNQGSYALITSAVLQNTFSELSQSQNGLGLQTFAYFSGIPWLDSPTTGNNPTVADAVVLSYVSNNSQFYADTVSDYNNDDSTTYCGSGICVGNQNIGIKVGGYTYLPSGFPIFMYEYGWAPITSGCTSPGPGCSSGYYVGILQYNDNIGYFLTTSYNNNPCSSNLCTSGYYDYYYSGAADSGSNYYFLEDNNSNGNNSIQGYNGGSTYFPFMPVDEQPYPMYYQYGVFWLYNWFQEDNNNMNIFFLMNGNIFNGDISGSSGSPLASVPYSWEGCGLSTCRAYAIPPNPPASIKNGEPIFAQSYINAYNTAFNQPANPQEALNNYNGFTYNEVNSNFVSGTFGYYEYYASLSQSLTISYLQDEASAYNGNPYLFVSAGSGGGSGYMYLDWVIVTYGVPYVASVS